MTESGPERSRKRKVRDHLADNVRRTPRWEKRLLWVALVVAVVGVAGQVVARVGTSAGREQASEDGAAAVDAPPGASRAFGTASHGESPTAAAAEPAEQPWWAKLSPGMTKVGASFIVGFLVAWVFRAFVKTMVLLALLIAGGLFALSYFGVIDLDLAAARETYDSSVGWISAHAARLKDAALAHVPSSAGGAAGALVGLWRK